MIKETVEMIRAKRLSHSCGIVTWLCPCCREEQTILVDDWEKEIVVICRVCNQEVRVTEIFF